ncbi:hypothetical protein GCM10027290_55150 [Micromonospora sonneratiae]|uniref:Excreted virulence factor EspC, type VII ESX diderm n=1 Tax=Micromonospora sonneratiae TaxID=1184706 RepID=A0ABW3YP18_9ACTN
MLATQISGDTEAMGAYSSQLTAPPMPPSLARLGTPPNLSGMFEGIAMSVLDKAATAELAAFLTKVTEDLVTDSAKVKAAAAGYTAADVAGALELAAASVKVVKQGVDLVKQLTATQTQSSGNPSTDEPTDDPAGDAPQPTV